MAPRPPQRAEPLVRLSFTSEDAIHRGAQLRNRPGITSRWAVPGGWGLGTRPRDRTTAQAPGSRAETPATHTESRREYREVIPGRFLRPPRITRNREVGRSSRVPCPRPRWACFPAPDMPNEDVGMAPHSGFQTVKCDASRQRSGGWGLAASGHATAMIKSTRRPGRASPSRRSTGPLKLLSIIFAPIWAIAEPRFRRSFTKEFVALVEPDVQRARRDSRASSGRSMSWPGVG